MNELDKYVDAYDNVYSLDNRLILQWYPKRVMMKSKGESLLELGLGHGYTAQIFSSQFQRYTVIEGSLEVIKRFYQKFPEMTNIQIINGYFESVELNEKYDNIVMGFILEHVDDPIFILNRYKEYLSPNGSIFVCVPNGEALNRRFGYEAGILGNMTELTSADLKLGHKRIFTLDSLEKLIVAQGYIIENIEGILLKPFTTAQISQLHLSEEILQAMLKVGINFPELCVGILMEIKRS